MSNLLNSYTEFVSERFLPDRQGLILVFLGAPGSGKGTLAKKMKEKIGFQVVSTGDVIRNSNDPKLKKIIEKGDLVPDDLMIDILEEAIEDMDPSKGIIIDGYPRTLEQAEDLDSLLGKMGLGLNHAIFLGITTDKAKERIEKRAGKENRSDDADPKVIERRFEEFKEKTLPIAGFYHKSRKLITIDADKSEKDVFLQVKKDLRLGND
jgi:adenylate kinase